VLQTTLDLLNKGYKVYVVADACSTTSQESRQFAIEVAITDLINSIMLKEIEFVV